MGARVTVPELPYFGYIPLPVARLDRVSEEGAMMERFNTVLTIPRPGEVRLVERPYPRSIPGYVLVKALIASICRVH